MAIFLQYPHECGIGVSALWHLRWSTTDGTTEGLASVRFEFLIPSLSVSIRPSNQRIFRFFSPASSGLYVSRIWPTRLRACHRAANSRPDCRNRVDRLSWRLRPKPCNWVRRSSLNGCIGLSCSGSRSSHPRHARLPGFLPVSCRT